MSITGHVGHVALAKQTAFGTPNVTAAQYRAVKLTGDSLVAANNMLVAENEIGFGRDVSQAVPGGFSAAGAINGNLRVRAASVFLEGALGLRTAVAPDAGPPATEAVDEFTPTEDLPVFTVEKKVGTTAPELLVLRYSDVMVNTLNLSAPSGGLATYSAGLIAAGESKQAAALVTPTYPAESDDLLIFHGGRIRHADEGTASPLTAGDNDATFQSMEVVINNNVQADEYTIRPSRFLRSLTEGFRNVETNMTIVFEDHEKYERYTYGAVGRTAPGYNLYHGKVEFFLGNWQIADADAIDLDTLTGGPTNPQAMELRIPRLVFAGLPVTLASGRIAVSTTARALKPASGDNIIEAIVRPSAAGFNY